jgi:uncharacterized membrane-anchored protein YjiN (DUF445 family)
MQFIRFQEWGSRTEELPSGAPAAPAGPPMMMRWGEGRRLDAGGLAPRPARSVLPEQARVIHERIQALIAQGCAEKIESLLTEFRDLLPQGLWDQLRETLRHISSEQSEQRAIAIAVLTVQWIWPLMKAPGDLDQQSRRLRCERLCREIIQMLLPGETVARFLDQCAMSIREERLLQQQCAIVEQAEHMQELIPLVSRVIRRQTEERCREIRERLLAFHRNREAQQEEIRREVGQFQETMRQMEQRMLRTAEQMVLLGQQDQEAQERIEALLAECQRMIRELL